MLIGFKFKVSLIAVMVGVSSIGVAKSEVLLTDLKMQSEQFVFTEGPVWDGAGFIFSDIPANKAYRWTPKGVEVVLDPSYYSNGRTRLKDGTIVSAHHDRTLRVFRDHRLTVLVDRYQGKKLNSPNDVVADAKGRLYFTDPTYGIAYDGFGPARGEEEQGVRGVYRLDPNGQMERLTGDLQLPNGLAFSPDQKHLYVADSSDHTIYRFRLDQKGRLSDKTAWAVIKRGESSIVDGIKVDSVGNLYAAVGGEVVVLSPKGKELQSLKVSPAAVANLAFGGTDGKTLFITASKAIYTATAKFRGN